MFRTLQRLNTSSVSALGRGLLRTSPYGANSILQSRCLATVPCEYVESVSTPRKFRHYKGGLYAVIGEGIHTETEENLVFYYDASDATKFYARPKEMFYSDIEWEGETKKRFTPIE